MKSKQYIGEIQFNVLHVKVNAKNKAEAKRKIFDVIKSKNISRLIDRNNCYFSEM
jgi:hypothetical protein